MLRLSLLANKPAVQPDVEAYWLQAQRHYERARADLGRGFYDGCVANSQQAAELVLKAAVVQMLRAPARPTHSLALLEQALRASGVAVPVAVATAIAGILERTWTRSRDPDPATNFVRARDITEQEARQALSDAEVIYTWVRQQLAPPPASSTGNS